MAGPVIVSAAVEGPVDEAVVQRLIVDAGGVPGPVYGKTGKVLLRRQIRGYSNAARRAPWIVLVDLDDEAECAPTLRRAWVPAVAPQMCLRVAVRAVEAWLMSDREGIAAFLGIAVGRVPREPQLLEDPKRSLVDLARTSRRPAIRADMVPREGSGRAVGPAYPTRMMEYVREAWRPGIAADRSESLRRAIACLERLIRAT